MAGRFLWRGVGTALGLADDWTEPALGAGPAPLAPGTADAATIATAGALDATGTLTVASLALEGQLALAAGAAIAVGGAAVAAGTIAIAAAGTLTAHGTLGLFAPISGGGTLAIAAGAMLFAADAVAAGLTASFAGAGGTLGLFTTGAQFAAAIAGFAAGDTIDIADATITSAAWSAGTLRLAAADGGALALALPGRFAGATFLALPDGADGSAVVLATPVALPGTVATLTLADAPLLETGSAHATGALAHGTVALAGRLQAGSLDATGVLDVLTTATLSAGTLTLAGVLAAQGAVAVGTATAAAGTVAIAAGAALCGSGTINGAIACAGTIMARGGVLALFGAVGGTGTLAIAAGATLFAAGAVGPAITVAFAAGATLDLAAPSSFAGSFAGLAAGDVIDAGFTTADPLPIAAALGGTRLRTAPDGAGGTLVTVACYAAGTRLATPAGPVPIERLRAGDRVLALAGQAWHARPVRWIGRARIDLAGHPCPAAAAPIRIRAHAVAPGVPCRDLLLSPAHAVFLDGAFLQAHALLNGATVTQEVPPAVTYLHIELDRHAVVLAENLPAESYLDTGNRALFAGEAGGRPLHPDLTAAAAWDERACAPLLLGGARVAAAHRRLLERARRGGATLTADPGLVVLADGQPMALAAPLRAWLPAGTRQVRLRSRSFVPAWLGLGADRRRLGVAVAALRLAGHALPRAAFGRGWHAAEAGWRWTDGDAELVLPPLPGPAPLAIRLATTGAQYWDDAKKRQIPRDRLDANTSCLTVY